MVYRGGCLFHANADEMFIYLVFAFFRTPKLSYLHQLDSFQAIGCQNAHEVGQTGRSYLVSADRKETGSEWLMLQIHRGLGYLKGNATTVNSVTSPVRCVSLMFQQLVTGQTKAGFPTRRSFERFETTNPTDPLKPLLLKCVCVAF